MKPGDPIKCPHCGADSFLKKESVMDGWTKVGEVLKCVSCSAVIEDCSKQKTESEKPDLTDRFRQFLGSDGEESVKVDLSKKDCRFCKDCANMVPHPFQLRCALTGQSVNPMDDCAHFKKK